jgi:hypothetical protein
MKMRRDTWTTYRVSGYTHALTQDQASAGGVILHQVRRTKRGWQKRAVQSNGNHSSATDPSDVADAEGEAAWEAAKKY